MTYSSIIGFLVRKKSKDNADTSVTFNLAVMALKSDQLVIIRDLQVREIFKFYTLTRFQTYSSINTHYSLNGNDITCRSKQCSRII